MELTIGKALAKVFGSRNDRLLKRFDRIVEQVNALEPQMQAMTDTELKGRTQELRAGLKAGTLASADVLHEAFAIMRESMDRHIGIRSIFDPANHFDPDQLDDEMWEAYDQVQQQMIASGVTWISVPIPHKLYQAVRALYPESRPPFRTRCFDVQIIGGMVLYEGKIAEMATGEGKTFVAPLACFMRVLEGLHCHVVTVNDYLVRRDASWVRPAFENLGLTVGFIQQDMDPGGETRRAQYNCDVTYGTNSEFGFDYLRDNMKERIELQVQGPLDFAIVDEVDSILIDEARTPLIISGAAHDDAAKYQAADTVARHVIEMNKDWMNVEKAIDAAKRTVKLAQGDEEKAKGDKALIEAVRHRYAEGVKALDEVEKAKVGVTQYIEVELDRKTAHLTHEGIAAAQTAAGVGSFYVGANMEWPHLMEQALRAHILFERDKEYVVEKQNDPRFSDIVIVDEYTGRKMQGRQWSDGLHQAVEAKERVAIKQETQTLATITLQNFFRLYKAVGGMTGTAQTEAEEFNKIYSLDVVTIPTNRKMVRDDFEDRVYRTEKEKWATIVDEIKEISAVGRPVLVGTTTVEKSEMLSTMLTRQYGVEHEVLNAKQHEREAQIIAKAGQQHVNAHGEVVGNVTIATNMAGRGTDIKLSAETTQAGGLHVIGSERHTARRIDNQLRGRGGRQGDPGSSRFYVSLQDELMALFAGEWTIKVLGWLGMEEGMAIEDRRISRGILRAQKKVEERNYLARKQLLDYDDVMELQRDTFYGMRQAVLQGQSVGEIIWDMIGRSIEDAVDKHITQDYVAATVSEWSRINFEVVIEPYDLRTMRDFVELEMYIKDQARAEAITNISATLGEFTGEEETDPGLWDAKHLSSWAMSRFQVDLSQAQIRRMTLEQLEEKLRNAAVEQINKRDCSGLLKYLEPQYAEGELAQWAREKFGIEITAEDMLADRTSLEQLTADQITALIEKRARAAYARREIEYPVDHTLTFAFGGQDPQADNAYAVEYVRLWLKAKYRVESTAQELRGLRPREIRAKLIKLQEERLGSVKCEQEVDELMAAHPAGADLAKVFNERYNARLKADDVDAHALAAAAAESTAQDATQIAGPAMVRDLLVKNARLFYRQELTELEQFVLIQILDQSWKDHLYAMDMLKAGIGLHAFAEEDPRVRYKKEGFGYFELMLSGIRDKVTDLIFRARVVGQTRARSAYREMSATHKDVGGYGVKENIAATAEALGTGKSEMAEAAEQPQGATKVKQIVRSAPKVGRNDPCPCGSGKKYKKCCGANAA